MMDIDGKQEAVESTAAKEEGKGTKPASIVPSLDLTRIIGGQSNPSSIVEVEIAGRFL